MENVYSISQNGYLSPPPARASRRYLLTLYHKKLMGFLEVKTLETLENPL